MLKYFISIVVIINLFHSSKSTSKIPFKILNAEDIFTFDFNNFNFDLNISNVTTNVSENLMIGSLICYIIIKGNNIEIKLNGNLNETFQLDFDKTGSVLMLESISFYSIKLNKKLDRETKSNYELFISNEDLKFSLNIQIDDINDNEPKFQQHSFEFNIIENNANNKCIGFIKAIDSDLGLNSVIKYHLLNDSLIGYKNILPSNQSLNDRVFSLNENTGQLCTNKVLDREQFHKYSIKAIAKDSTTPKYEPINEAILININVLDQNDNKPIFYQPNLNKRLVEFYLKENSPEDSFVAWLKAYDLDEGINSEIEYSLANNTNLFNIDSNGVLRSSITIRLINPNIQFNKTNNTYWTTYTVFPLEIIAKDKGNPTKINRISIKVKLVSEKEDNKEIKISLDPNKTVINVRSNLENSYSRPLVRVDAQIENITNSRLLYQIIPMSNENNCTQDDVLKLFTITKQGEIYLSKTFKAKNQTIICFITIKVLEMEQVVHLSSEVNFTFIVSSVADIHSLKSDHNIKKMTKYEATLNFYIICTYVAILLIMFLILFAILAYNIRLRYRNKVLKQTEQSKDPDNDLTKINIRNLFKWFDNYKNSYSPNSSSYETNSTSISCNSLAEQNLIKQSNNSNAILKQTGMILQKIESSQKKSIFKLPFKNKPREAKRIPLNDDDFNEFNLKEVPKYGRKHIEDYYLDEKIISYKPNSNDDSIKNCSLELDSLKNCGNYCGVYKISNQIIIDYDNCNRIDNNCSFSSFSTSTSASSSVSRKTPEEQLERFEQLYYDNKKYLDTNLSQFLFDVSRETAEINMKKALVV